VLAAGFGTRMLPLSRDLPKAVMPLWGKPMLQHALELLRSWGVREVVVNCHHKPEELLPVALRVAGILRMNLSYEPEILGTGGALMKAAWFLADEPFWLINADVAADLQPHRLLRAFAAPRTMAAAWVHPTRGPRTIEMKRNLITSFQSAHPATAGTWTFCGLQLLSPEILRYLPAEGFSSIIQGYQAAQHDGWRIRGVEVPGSYWADVGTPGQYLETHRETADLFRLRRPGGRLFVPTAGRRLRTAARRRITASGVVALGENVSLGRNVVLHDAILWDGVRVEAGAEIRHCVAARGSRLSGSCTRAAGPADRLLDGDERAAVEALGWSAHRTMVHALGARGSGRSFVRLRHAASRAILIRYTPTRRENELYAEHARFLRRLGISVPRVLADHPEQRLCILEDAGDRSLEDFARASSSGRRLETYRRVLEQVVRLHRLGRDRARKERLPLTDPFGPRLYRYEAGLFLQLIRVAAPRAEALVKEVGRELNRVARNLARSPQVLIHRDLQSSNVLLRGGTPVFIDFQGMRIGPAAYDLASLLCDPYVELTEREQEVLRAWYAAAMGYGDELEPWFWWAAAERLAQALGAFGRLCRIPGMESFAHQFRPGTQMLRRALDHLPPLPNLREACDIVSSQFPDTQNVTRARRHLVKSY